MPRALATQTPDQVGQAALAALRQILPVPADVSLAHVQVTQWSTDPWTGHGSYSYLKLGSTPEDYRVWEKGYYNQRVWFAGEATLLEYLGTVTGAYLSGERAAKACFDSLATK